MNQNKINLSLRLVGSGWSVWLGGAGGDGEYLRKLLNNTFDGNKLLLNCGFLVLQIVKKTDGVHGAGSGRDNISEINFSCLKYFVTDTKIVINEMSVDGMVLAATDVVNSSFLTSPLPVRQNKQSSAEM